MQTSSHVFTDFLCSWPILLAQYGLFFIYDTSMFSNKSVNKNKLYIKLEYIIRIYHIHYALIHTYIFVARQVKLKGINGILNFLIKYRKKLQLKNIT